jgi:hypothetical protein
MGLTWAASAANLREGTVAFIQIIECRTDRYDDLKRIEAEWRAATEGKRTLRRSIITRDRNDPSRHLILAFFDSYESAMVNSDLAETSEFGRKQQELITGPMTFHDLDVLDEKTD